MSKANRQTMTTDIQPTSTRTVSERLADHVVGLRFEDLPPSVVDKAKDLLVHHLGLALRARAGASGEAALQVATSLRVADELSGPGPDGVCSIVGDARKVDLLEGVFANCSLVRGTSTRSFGDLLLAS
jgi:2-methylcitrate dehydratase PrpD